jgi:hypothetical protein
MLDKAREAAATERNSLRRHGTGRIQDSVRRIGGSRAFFNLVKKSFKALLLAFLKETRVNWGYA